MIILRKFAIILFSCVPLVNMFIDEPYFNFRFIFPIVFFCIILLIIRSFLKKKYVLTLNDFLFFCLLILYIVNITLLNNFDKSLNVFITMFFSVFSLFFISKWKLTNKEIKLYFNLNIIIGFIFAIYFIFNKVPTDGDPNRFVVIFRGGVKQDPNYFAASFMLPYLLSLYMFNNNTSSFKRILYFANSILTFYCVLMTGSRATFICLFLSTAIIFSARIRKHLLFTIVSFSICVFILSFFVDFSRFFDLSTYFDASNSDRFLAWQAALKMGLQSPVLGKGFYAGYSLSMDFGAVRYMSIHNAYLELFAETGIIATFLFIYLLFSPILKSKNLLIYAIFFSTFLSSCVISSHISAYLWINIYAIHIIYNNQKKNLVRSKKSIRL